MYQLPLNCWRHLHGKRAALMFLTRCLFIQLRCAGCNGQPGDSRKLAVYFGFQWLVVYEFFIFCSKGRDLLPQGKNLISDKLLSQIHFTVLKLLTLPRSCLSSGAWKQNSSLPAVGGGWGGSLCCGRMGAFKSRWSCDELLRSIAATCQISRPPSLVSHLRNLLKWGWEAAKGPSCSWWRGRGAV